MLIDKTDQDKQTTNVEELTENVIAPKKKTNAKSKKNDEPKIITLTSKKSETKTISKKNKSESKSKNNTVTKIETNDIEPIIKESIHNDEIILVKKASANKCDDIESKYQDLKLSWASLVKDLETLNIKKQDLESRVNEVLKELRALGDELKLHSTGAETQSNEVECTVDSNMKTLTKQINQPKILIQCNNHDESAESESESANEDTDSDDSSSDSKQPTIDLSKKPIQTVTKQKKESISKHLNLNKNKNKNDSESEFDSE